MKPDKSKMRFLAVRFEIDTRSVGEDGTFNGYGSVFGNLDSYDTVVEKGAFKKTIKDHGGEFPLLWFHNPMRPVGMAKVVEDEKGLRVEGTLDLDTEDGRNMYSGLKKGYIDRMSIGFNVISGREEKKDDKWIFFFTEVRLWEVSLITRNFAANELALVEQVRNSPAILGMQTGKPQFTSDGIDLDALVEGFRAFLSGKIGSSDDPEETRNVPPVQKIDIADRDHSWDGSAAEDRMWEASGENQKLYARGHLWYDGSADDGDNDGYPDNRGDYKLPICDIIDGKLTIVPQGVFHAAGRLDQLEGVSDGDVSKIKRRISAYYAMFRDKFNDESLVAPWEQKSGGDPEQNRGNGKNNPGGKQDDPPNQRTELDERVSELRGEVVEIKTGLDDIRTKLDALLGRQTGEPPTGTPGNVTEEPPANVVEEVGDDNPAMLRIKTALSASGTSEIEERIRRALNHK